MPPLRQLPRRKQLARRAAIVIASVLGAVVVGELYFRLFSRGPWGPAPVVRNEPTMGEFDAELGWKNKPGSYRTPPYHPSGTEIESTFLEDGRRRTSADDAPERDEVLFVGGSYVQGWAISDHETCAWKVQSAFPELRVLNLGVGGYGTYQSLLVLERVLPERERVELVLYGLMPHHEVRNVAPYSWMADLARFSARGSMYVPYATLDEAGALVRHAPESHVPSWPLVGHSALVAGLERARMSAESAGRARQARAVTETVLREMRALCAAHDARFAVVLFDMKSAMKEHYQAFLAAEGIPAIDCSFPESDELRVPGEGHPNGAMHSKWAARIVSFLQAERLGSD